MLRVPTPRPMRTVKHEPLIRASSGASGCESRTGLRRGCA